MLESNVTFASMMIFIIAGLVAGGVYGALNLFRYATKHNKIVTFMVDILACLCGGVIFNFCIIKFQFGLFAWFEVLSFAIGIIFEQIIVKNLFARPINYVYNKIKLKQKVKKSC